MLTVLIQDGCWAWPADATDVANARANRGDIIGALPSGAWTTARGILTLSQQPFPSPEPCLLRSSWYTASQTGSDLHRNASDREPDVRHLFNSSSMRSAARPSASRSVALRR